MCGIAGYIGKKRIDDSIVNGALTQMVQRGPDAQRSWKYENDRYNVYLLHSRLSIIDLDPRSHQPFEINDYVMVFNGEIYNYLELREELVSRNIALRTSSDTEVLLHYYIIHGEECVKYFEGMWAFVIFNRKDEKVFISRDRFGEKPLYYYQDGVGFYFASEVKALSALANKSFDVDENHVIRYIINGHKSLYKGNSGFYTEVKEVDIASCGVVSIEGNVETHKYWTPQYTPNEKMTFDEAVEGTHYHLRESLKIRLRSDVPLAFCLSGGVDSASLVSIAAKEFNANVNTFSIIDSDQRYDELDNIQATVDDTGCKSTKIMLQPGDQNIERLISLVKYHDAPVATISYFVHSMLSEAIASNGYKISISGTAADEMFTGYYDHFLMHLYESKDMPSFDKNIADWTEHVKHFVRHPDLSNPKLFFPDPSYRDYIYLNNDDFRSFLKKDWKEDFYETNYSDSLLRNRMMNELFHEVVRVILHEDDLNSMKYSIENRSPFLDANLYGFTNTIPSHLLIGEGYNKFVLRSSMKGILNDQVRLSREKKGFNASINSIFDFKNPQHRDFFLSESRIFDWFEKDKINELLDKQEFSNSYKKFLFNFICAKIFLDDAAKA